MPIHKVGDSWQWGEHGKKYSNRKDAERQAAAAYSNGYKGKSFDEAAILALSEATLTEVISKKNTTMGSKDPFAVKRTETGTAMPLPTKRIYIGDNDKAPEGVYIQPGPRGGRFYEVQVGGKASGKPVKPIPQTSGQGEDPTKNKPFKEHEVGAGGKTSQEIEDPGLHHNTIQVIRELLAKEKIYPAKQQEDGTVSVGYTIGEYHGDYDVRGTGPTKDIALKTTKHIAHILNGAGLKIDFHGGTIHVKPLPGDPKSKLSGLTEIHRSVAKALFEDDIKEVIDNLSQTW